MNPTNAAAMRWLSKSSRSQFSLSGLALASVVLFAIVSSGCGKSPAQVAPPPMAAPEVQVSLPVSGEVTDYEDFPGRIQAVNSVEIRVRVTGYLEKVHFREGADVKKGDLLFEIDPRPYEAELERAEGNFIQSEGRLTRLNGDFERAQSLFAKGALSKEEMERIVGDRREAQGAAMVNKGARDLAALNLSFTKVHSPLSGRISSRSIDPGNLVKADDTSMTSIVSLDPVYATFDLDERTLLRLKRLIRDKQINWSLEEGLPVYLGLADEDGFPHKGVINFADNHVDPDTGTWRLRGRFDNDDHALSPGLFVRVRLPIGNSYHALLVAEAALGSDQGQKFIYVVDETGHVEYRRIKVGRLHDGLRVVAEGLATGEKVVISGLQRVRQGVEVKPELVPMPEPGREIGGTSGGKSSRS
ncbi:MAG TPA: efflux RND transporter periplasmic adaptor subunit [Planctomycetaceae bacterium]|nr:efflux RND transporter periplasmic adaptor subunit [Planctomycetaceae bacterium]